MIVPGSRMDWNRAPDIQAYTFSLDSGFDQILNWNRKLNGSDGGFREGLWEFGEFRASKQIWRYMAPVILVVGTIGSVLSLLVLCRKSLRAHTTMFYLSVLAIADLMVLYAGLVRLWLEHAENTYIRLTSLTACKLHNFFVYLSLDLCVWTLVAVSVDRCLYVSWPASARRWCTLVNARIVVSVIFFLSALVNVHFFWTYDLELFDSQQIYANGNKKCYADTSSSLAVGFVENVWPWIDFCIYCLCPFLFMATSNAIIIKQLVRTDRNMASYQKVVLDRARRAISEEGQGQRARSPLKMTSASLTCSQRSKVRSNETSRAECGGLAGMPQGDSFEMFGPAKGCFHNPSLEDDNQQMSAAGVTHIDGVSPFDVQGVGVRGRSPQGDRAFVDVQHHEPTDVINVQLIDLDTFGGSLKNVSLTLEVQNMVVFVPRLALTLGQGHLSPPAEVTSVDGGPSEIPCSQWVDITSADKCPTDNPGTSADLGSTRRAHALLPGSASRLTELLLLNDLTSSTDPSNRRSGSQVGHHQINVVTLAEPQVDYHQKNVVTSAGPQVDLLQKNVVNLAGPQVDLLQKNVVTLAEPQSGQDPRLHKRTEVERDVTNKTYPVCNHFHERPDHVMSVGDPVTSASNEACTSVWSTQTSDRDLILRDIDSKSETRLVDGIVDNRNIHTISRNSVNGSDNCQFEGSVSLASCFSEGGARVDARTCHLGDTDDLTRTTDSSRGQVNLDVPDDLTRTTDSSRREVTLGNAGRSSSTLNNKWRSANPGTERQISTSSRRTTSSVSKTLLAVTIMFWLFNAPIVIFIIGHTYFASVDGRGRALIILGWAVVNILQYMNNALHFFLYCLTGPKFRHELRDMFREWILFVTGRRSHRLTE